MRCNKARRMVVTEARWPFRRLAHRHVSECAACAAWLASVNEMAEILSTVPPHKVPEQLEQRMLDAASPSIEPPIAASGSSPILNRKQAGEALPTVAARQYRANTKNPLGRLKMKRLVFITAGFALAGWMAFFEWGGSGMATADLRRALDGVKVVHMVGEQFAVDNSPLGVIPQAYQVNKWMRVEPLAVFEENTALVKSIPLKTSHFIFAGNSKETYWYFPGVKKKVHKSRGLTASFLADMMPVLQPSEGQSPDLKKIGSTNLDGKTFDLLETEFGGFRSDLAVDPQSKLAYRFRQYVTGKDGKEIKIADLRFYYDQTPPPNVFDWRPPADTKSPAKMPQ